MLWQKLIGEIKGIFKEHFSQQRTFAAAIWPNYQS
jgi:hypothetical protein